jgi:hypothetical protein
MGSARRNAIRLTAVGLCVALCAAAVGCGKPGPAPVGGSTSSRAERARKDAEALALGGVSGGAAAHAKADPESVRHQIAGNIKLIPNPPGSAVKGSTQSTDSGKGPVIGPLPAPPPVAKGPPGPRSTPRSGWVIREHVVCAVPSATEAEAEEDVVALARKVVVAKLAELDPPLNHTPSPGEVRTEFLRKDSRVVRHPDAAEKEAMKLDGDLRTDNFVYVEYDVEVTADQVRELRAQERVSAGLRVVGLVLAVALAGFLFLRADEWTRGYLTRWLALAAVALAGGAAAALIFV